MVQTKQTMFNLDISTGKRWEFILYVPNMVYLCSIHESRNVLKTAWALSAFWLYPWWTPSFNPVTLVKHLRGQNYCIRLQSSTTLLTRSSKWQSDRLACPCHRTKYKEAVYGHRWLNLNEIDKKELDVGDVSGYAFVKHFWLISVYGQFCIMLNSPDTIVLEWAAWKRGQNIWRKK